jgi:hypothetical protein
VLCLAPGDWAARVPSAARSAADKKYAGPDADRRSAPFGGARVTTLLTWGPIIVLLLCVAVTVVILMKVKGEE